MRTCSHVHISQSVPCAVVPAAKLVPVGYGIKKMTIMMTIVDDLVSVDELVEEQLTQGECAEFIQSCDIVAFNKICKLDSSKLYAVQGQDSGRTF